jgi:hypothetical protein
MELASSTIGQSYEVQEKGTKTILTTLEIDAFHLAVVIEQMLRKKKALRKLSAKQSTSLAALIIGKHSLQALRQSKKTEALSSVTAAGVALDKPFLDHEWEESRRILDINVRFAPAMPPCPLGSVTRRLTRQSGVRLLL